MRCMVLLLMTLFGLPLGAQGTKVSALQHPASEFIFTPGSTSFPQSHASTVVELKNGDLLAAWFGGAHEGAPDVAIWMARFHGGHWSAPEVVAREHEVPTWNPVLFHTLDGRLWLYYKAGETAASWSAARRVSSDEGKTWSAPERLPAGLLGPIRAKPLVMADGTIVAGSSVEAYKTWACWIERSTDGGVRWKKIGPITLTEAQDKAEPPSVDMRIADPELRAKQIDERDFKGIIQPTVVSLGGQHLRLYARSLSRAAKIMVADSQDGGLTWSKTRFLQVPNNNSGLDVVVLKDGRVVLLCNNVPSGRTPLTLLESADGEHFKPFATLEDAPGEYSYPALIQRRDGDLEMTYTWQRTAIKHVHLKLSDVPR